MFARACLGKIIIFIHNAQRTVPTEGLGRAPVAKSLVVLARQHHVFDARLLEQRGPLVWVPQLSGELRREAGVLVVKAERFVVKRPHCPRLGIRVSDVAPQVPPVPLAAERRHAVHTPAKDRRAVVPARPPEAGEAEDSVSQGLGTAGSAVLQLTSE